jgi:TetR/AcrR family transcriptional regulator
MERRKARTAESILDAAERLFLDRGYQVTTVQDLADEADVAIASLYVHFGSKEGVYLALVERAAELDRRYMDAAYDSADSPDAQLSAVLDAVVRFYREHPGLFRLFALRSRSDGPAPYDVPAAAAVLNGRIEEELERTSSTVERAISQGLIRPVDPRRTAKLMWAAGTGVVAVHAREDQSRMDDRELEALLDQAREIFSLGLLAPGRR